jgi:trans-2,3-dihydro-3-hydroxyanthranilate isomerase
MVPVKDKTLEIELDKAKRKWLNDHCKTAHQALYFFCLEDAKLTVECYVSKKIN